MCKYRLGYSVFLREREYVCHMNMSHKLKLIPLRPHTAATLIQKCVLTGSAKAPSKPTVTQQDSFVLLTWVDGESGSTPTYGYLIQYKKRGISGFVIFFLSCRSCCLADRWGTTVDFTTSFLHSSRLSAFRSSMFHSRPVRCCLPIVSSVCRFVSLLEL